MAVLSVAASSTVLAGEFSRTYSPSFSQNKNLPHVFKLTDSNGNVSYSASIADEFIQIEKVVIAAPPSEAHMEDTRQRHDKLKTAAL